MRRIDDRDAELRELEPSVRCVEALWSGTTGVVDQSALMASYAAAVEARRRLDRAEARGQCASSASGGGFEIAMTGPDGASTTITAEALVNSAGLGAPAIASMLGYPLDGGEGLAGDAADGEQGALLRHRAPEKARALRHLVYPVPEHGKGGLGVHVTLDVDGGVHLGPDTEWLDDGAPLDYRADDGGARTSTRRRAATCRRCELDDIAPGQVGYRPEAAGARRADRRLPDLARRRYVHLGGIESPGHDGEPGDRARGGVAVVGLRAGSRVTHAGG